MLHHHIWSPCFRKNKGLWSNTIVPGSCKSTTACTGQDAAFALSAGYSTGTNKVNSEVIGLAKDGHIMYGPWDATGNQYSCDSHDVCNGTFMADGSYGYVMTTTFPYTIGCWGPGPA
jgi:hypothetical protein